MDFNTGLNPPATELIFLTLVLDNKNGAFSYIVLCVMRLTYTTIDSILELCQTS